MSRERPDLPRRMRRKNRVTSLICPYCPVPTRIRKHEVTADHIVPTGKNGLHTKHNRVFCCYACNQLKSDFDPRRPFERDLKEPPTLAIRDLWLNITRNQLNKLRERKKVRWSPT